MQLAPILDPLSLAEGLKKKEPKEFAKRIVYYNFVMDKYLADVLDIGPDAVDRDAINDINLINRGRTVIVRDEPSKEYLTTYANYLESPLFRELPAEVQKKHIEFIKATKDQVAVAIKQEAPEEGAAADTTGTMTPGGEAPLGALPQTEEPGAFPEPRTNTNLPTFGVEQ